MLCQGLAQCWLLSLDAPPTSQPLGAPRYPGALLLHMVGCRYGFNRTGFVVCSYLCEACGYSVEEAVAAFAVSRPPGIRHEHFRAELYARYGSAAPLHPALPPAGPAVSGSSGEQAGSTNGRCSQVPASGAAAVPPPAQSSTTAVAQSVVTRASTVVTACRITTNTSAVAVPDVGQAAEQTVTSPRLSPFSPLAASMLATEDGDVCTPALQHSGGAGAAGPGAPLTPALSENESLGISDRIIMQSFRYAGTLLPFVAGAQNSVCTFGCLPHIRQHR